jgi:cholesterol oxidase
MGRDRAHGVVDHKCRVFDASPGAGSTAVHDGLYVIDGAVMPRSLGVNPLLTITALAERALLHLAADLGLSFDDKARHYAAPLPATAPGGS